jgi:phosphotransferase system HPr (HPr) family protein
MLEDRVRVINELGLHARAAAQLVRKASLFQSKIMLFRSDRAVSANAKSILSVLYIAAGVGTELLVRVEGPDEAEAMESVLNLFATGFGELE